MVNADEAKIIQEFCDAVRVPSSQITDNIQSLQTNELSQKPTRKSAIQIR